MLPKADCGADTMDATDDDTIQPHTLLGWDRPGVLNMSRLFLALIALALAPSAIAESSLLLVKITDSEFTDYSNCTDDNCIPHSFWTIHNAIVKKTIAGSYSKKKVRFVRLQHGQYIESIREHLFVLIDETENADFDKQFGTRIVARDTAYPVSLVCFDADLRAEFPDVERFEYDEGQLKTETCFDRDMIENGPDND